MLSTYSLYCTDYINEYAEIYALLITYGQGYDIEQVNAYNCEVKIILTDRLKII